MNHLGTTGFVLVLASFASCRSSSTDLDEGLGDGEDGGGGMGNSSGTGGRGAGGGASGTSSDASADTGATRHGLLERPSNASCKPPSDFMNPPRLLSETGCMDPRDPRRPGPGLLPYDVASPLWSDAAEKERFLALPDGARIRVRDCVENPSDCDPSVTRISENDGDFTLPDGSVAVKTFKLAGRYVETRLLVKFDADNWFGYSYEWNDAQTDAAVRPDEVNGFLKAVPDGKGGVQTWHFPSRAQCLQCHTNAAGVSLGLETSQLNRSYRYPNGVEENQLDAFERVGLFEGSLRRPFPPAFVDPADTRLPVTARARSYLETNCAICHRPKGNFEQIDLRFGLELSKMKICNEQPEKGDLGIPGALRLVPGVPGKSLISLRMKTLGDGRMPQIGSRVVDNLGAKLVEDWVAGLTGCQ